MCNLKIEQLWSKPPEFHFCLVGKWRNSSHHEPVDVAVQQLPLLRGTVAISSIPQTVTKQRDLQQLGRSICFQLSDALWVEAIE